MFNYRLQCWSLLTIKHFDAFLEEKYGHVFFDSDSQALNSARPGPVKPSHHFILIYFRTFAFYTRTSLREQLEEAQI